MGELAAAAIGLAIAGLDPVGAFIAIGALARGIRTRWVVGYGLVVLAGSVLLGTLLSIAVGRRLAEVDWAAFLPQGGLGAVVELAAATGLLVWAFLRFRRPATSAKKPRRRPSAGLALIGVGGLFAASAVLDPSFDALVVIAGRGVPIWQIAVAHSLWILISQVPLTVLLLTIACGWHDRAMTWFQRWWERRRRTIGHILTIILALAGLTLALDGVWYLVTGAFLLPGS